MKNDIHFDYLVIIAYFLIIVVIGFEFKKFNKNTSDYFHIGGSMLWQLVGATTFMSIISAVTYTGAAGKAYEAGIFIFEVYFANGLGFLMSHLFFCYRLRAMLGFKLGWYNQTNGKHSEINRNWWSGAETYGGNVHKQYADGNYAEVWIKTVRIAVSAILLKMISVRNIKLLVAFILFTDFHPFN